jgi:RimJ/RimL family protein N-acetyltransferase
LIYETDRLIIRAYEPDDAPFVLDMYSRWDVQQYLGTAPKILQNLDEASSAIQRWRGVSDGNQLLGVWAVTLRTHEPVGTVMLKMAPLSSDQRPLPLSDDHEVGWHLHPGHWGHGYATEATAGAMRRAFDAGVDTVIALIVPANDRSRLVAERLGMKHAGLTDRYYSIEADLYVAGREEFSA